MAKVWADVTGTMQSLFKFGQHRLKSDTSSVSIESRNGASTLLDVSPSSFQLSSRRFFISSSTPTTGTYLEGDIIYNSTPGANGIIGWYCTTGGDPGSWASINDTPSLKLISGILPTVSNKTYSILIAPSTLSLSRLSLKLGAGTCLVTLTNDGVTVPNVSAVAVGTDAVHIDITSGNSISVDGVVEIIVTDANSASDLTYTVTYSV